MEFEPVKQRTLLTLEFMGSKLFADVFLEIIEFHIDADCFFSNAQPLLVSGDFGDDSYHWTGEDGHPYARLIPEIGAQLEQQFQFWSLLP